MPRRLRLGDPLWLSGRDRQRGAPSLEGTLTADVVIVGGGFIGAIVALQFASAGLSVVLLEGRRFGRGSTAANSGLLIQEPDENLTALTKRYGTRRARRIWRLCAVAMRDLITTLEKRNVSCGISRAGSVHFATTVTSADALREEHDARKRADIAGTWLNADDMATRVGVPALAGIATRAGACLDPYRACLGLLRSAAAEGARLFEQSPVVNITSNEDDVIVRTDCGAVHARRVIVATGYATPAFRPLAGLFDMKQTYVMTSAPITPRTRERIGLADVMLWSAEHPYHYARWAGSRLIIGGEDRTPLSGRRRREAFGRSRRQLVDYFVRLVPELRAVRFERAWEGLFAITPDGLPYIGAHPRYPNHLFALGYGGNGMTFGALAARLLLGEDRAKAGADHALFAFDRMKS